MIRKLEASHDNVIGYSVGGEVSGEEYARTASEHQDDVERMAIVSDDTVTELLTKLGDTVASVEVEHSDGADEDKAWAWLA